MMDAREEMGKGYFTDLDVGWGCNGKGGVVASLEGCRAVLNALVVGEITIDRKDRTELVKEWLTVLDSMEDMEKRGVYSDEPYNDMSQDLKPETKGSPHCYTSAVSWIVSTSILFHFAATSSFIDEKNRISMEEADIERTKSLLVTSLDVLERGRNQDGGWSWRDNLPKSDLYWTLRGIRAISDFFDYVMGENQDVYRIEPDNELIQYINTDMPDLIQRIDKIRGELAEFLSKNYLGLCLKQKLKREDVLPKEIGEIMTPEYEQGNDMILLYYELYLMEALVLVKFDFDRDAEGKYVPNPGKRKKMDTLFNLLNMRVVDIRNPEFAENPEKSTLKINIHGLIKDVRSGKCNEYFVNDAGLWPQLVRSLVLYRLFTKPDPNESPIIVGKDGAYAILMDDWRDPKKFKEFPGTWDSENYLINLTANAIECLCYIYDYWNFQQNLKREENLQYDIREAKEDLARVMADSIFPHLEKRILEMIEKGSQGKIGKKGSEPPGTIEKIITDLREQSGNFVEKNEFRHLLSNNFNDLVHMTQDGSLEDIDKLAKRTLEKNLENKIKESNPEGYEIIKALIWMTYYVSSSLMPYILTGALLKSTTDKDLEKYLQKANADGMKAANLQDRFMDVFLTFMAHEQDAMKKASKESDLPNYSEILARLLKSEEG